MILSQLILTVLPDILPPMVVDTGDDTEGDTGGFPGFGAGSVSLAGIFSCTALPAIILALL